MVQVITATTELRGNHLATIDNLPNFLRRSSPSLNSVAGAKTVARSTASLPRRVAVLRLRQKRIQRVLDQLNHFLASLRSDREQSQLTG